MIQRSLRAVVTIETESGSGSGFCVGSSGLIMTNAHVVIDASKITVRTQAGDTFLARLVKVVEDADLALVQIPAQDLPELQLGGDEPPPVGSDVVTMGSPLGLQGTVTRGILSGIRRGGGVTLLQIDAAINPGNSGGPLLTDDGKVIGVNSSRMRPSDVESMGFAVAISEARKAFGSLLYPSRKGE
jgi:serine protease Do